MKADVMSDEFVPFGGELAEEKPEPQFVRHASDTAPDPEKPAAPTPVVPSEDIDIADRLRGVLQENLGANLAEDTLEKVVQSIAQTVDSAPTRLALPDLKLQDSPTEPPAEGATPREKPEITLEKEDNRVNRIQVNCTCGETMVMEVLY